MSGGPQPPFQQWAIATQASSSLIGPTIVGIFLDWQLGWAPWGTLIGVLIGFASSMLLLIRLARRGGSND